VSGINKKTERFPCLALFSLGSSFFSLYSSCSSGSALEGREPTFKHFIPIDFKNFLTWVGLRFIPVNSSILSTASFKVQVVTVQSTFLQI
jgi:hypothetical protein